MTTPTGNKFGHPQGACGKPGCTGCNPNSRLAQIGEAVVEMTAPPVPFQVNEGACLTTGGTRAGVRVVKDDSGSTVTVRGRDGVERDVPRDTLISGRMRTEERPVADIGRYDLVVHEGTVYEVAAVTGDHETVTLDLDGYEDRGDGDGESNVTYPIGDHVQTLRTTYISPEEAIALDPEAMTDDEFTARFKPVHNDETTSDIWESIPSDVPEQRVWTQVQYLLDDGRERFYLVPGYDRDGLNYVVTENPWEPGSQSADMRVVWD